MEPPIPAAVPPPPSTGRSSPASAATLAALRARVRALEGGGGVAGAASLGDGALDAALPQGGLQRGALHEAAPAAFFDGGAALGFLLAAAACAIAQGGLIWVRRAGAGAFGAPYAPGLAAFGIDPARLTIVAARSAPDLFWAAEEAARGGAGVTLIEHPGRSLDLVGARRLQLAAEAGGGLVLLAGGLGGAGAGAARTRWRIAARASPIPDWAQEAGLGGVRLPPGRPAWRAELIYAKGARPAAFDLEWRHETHRLSVAAPVGDRALAAGEPRSQRRRAG